MESKYWIRVTSANDFDGDETLGYMMPKEDENGDLDLHSLVLVKDHLAQPALLSCRDAEYATRRYCRYGSDEFFARYSIEVVRWEAYSTH